MSMRRDTWLFVLGKRLCLNRVKDLCTTKKILTQRNYRNLTHKKFMKSNSTNRITKIKIITRMRIGTRIKI